MFCKNCGHELDDNAVVCVHCGTPTDNFGKAVRPSQADGPSGGFAVLCFFFPIAGLILYLVWKDSLPLRAKSCGKGAIIGVIVEVVLIIVYIIIVLVVVGGIFGMMANY